MELDIVNANPTGLDVLDTPTLREAAGGYEVLFELINRGTVPIHGCWTYLIAKGELAELIDFAEVRLDDLGPGEHRPVRLIIQEPRCDETIVMLTLQLMAAGATTAALLDFLQPIHPAARPQVLGYDGEGFIVALDEVGSFPLKPNQTRTGRMVLGPVDPVIATAGHFAVTDAIPGGPAANPS